VSLSLSGGDLSRRGERVYESYSRRGGDLARSPLKSSLLSSLRGEYARRGGDRGLALHLSSSRRGLRDLLRNGGVRLRGREERPPGV
jgi:hypothetical protein